MASKGPADSPEVLAWLAKAMTFAPSVVAQLRRESGGSMGTDDDLIASANEGALNAARTFDPSRGLAFDRWAWLRMRGAVIDGVRRTGMLSRRMRDRLRALEASLSVEESMAEEDASSPNLTADAADARLDDYLRTMATAMAAGSLFVAIDGADEVADEAMNAEELLEQKELRARVRSALSTLRENERALVEHHLIQGETLEQAGARLGMSRSWACRIYARAIAQLTTILRTRGAA